MRYSVTRDQCSCSAARRTATSPDRARQGAPLVSEELTLDERVLRQVKGSSQRWFMKRRKDGSANKYRAVSYFYGGYRYASTAEAMKIIPKGEAKEHSAARLTSATRS